ncbi:CatB-related O-acetyltransferase [Sabulibacter ruber]|uniref:CatB-related O-acetyltransferase n=1 Tax=Sabulibacter ruber TaxID=2811901 RepID=UPI001A978F11|nr:CatB-related O-acetyltransferase [Sabulibacter ruber]
MKDSVKFLIDKILIVLLRRLKFISLISKHSKIHPSASVEGSVIIGDVNVGPGCKILNCHLEGVISIGNFTSLWGPNINMYSAKFPIIIGKYCSIARNVSFQEFYHNSRLLTTYLIHKNIFKVENENSIVSKGGITIGNDVWIGMHCCILSGVHIGHGAVIAANSVVNSDVPPYAICAGSPAKIVGFRFNNEIIEVLLRTNWWDWDLAKITRNKFLFENELTLELLNEIIE